jgi:hypothetical protein
MGRDEVRKERTLMPEITDAKKLLDEINAAVASYDPVLKEQARDILLKQAFGVAAKPVVEASNDNKAPGLEQPTEIAFHELVEKWEPQTQSEWALLGAYFFQVTRKNQSVTALQVNNELKQHGQNIANITASFDENIEANPALMRQTGKSGTSKQAKKTYVVTTSGINFVNDQLNGGNA